jgi:tetratricopeptide (TPR) repeat protein
MDYDALLSQVIDLLQREKRVPYRALKRRFDIDDDYIEDLKIDIIEAKQLAVDENDRILVWVGETGSAIEPTASAPMPELASPPTTAPEQEPLSYTPPHLAEKILTSRSALEGERKQVTGLAYLCLASWSFGNYAQARLVLHEGMTKAKERGSRFIIGRLTNTLGWFHRDLGDLSRASEYNHESIELGKTSGISNVEVSALINLGLDYLALGQHDRALSYLAPTLDRVEREAFGAHRWRWTIRLLTGLAEHAYTTGDYDQALRYVEEGLKEAQRTSSQKYMALGWALRGKIIAKLGDAETAGTELQRAFTLADQLQSPSLIYPIAYDFGQWHESTGKEREAATLYGKAKTTIEQMATAVEDEALRSTFLQAALVQEIHEHATRLGV